MSVTTLSVFTQFLLTEYEYLVTPKNLAAIALTSENWPTLGGGYPMMVSRQVGGPGFGEGCPVAWLPGAVGGTLDPYLPQVTQDGTPVLYQKIMSTMMGGTPAVFGLSTSGALVLAATQDSAGRWHAGQVLPVNASAANCTDFVLIPPAKNKPVGNLASPEIQVVGLNTSGVPVLASVFDDGKWAAGAGPGTTASLKLNPAVSTYSSLALTYHEGHSWLLGLSGGIPYIIAVYGYGTTIWTAGQPNNQGTKFSLRPYQPADGTLTYTSLVGGPGGEIRALGSDGQLYALGIGPGQQWTSPSQGYSFSSIAVSGNCTFALDENGAAYAIPNAVPVADKYHTPVAAQPIYEYGQQVAFTQLAVAPGADGRRHCLGLGAASGQLYEICTWAEGRPAAPTQATGQGRLPGKFSQNAYSAQVMAAQLVTSAGTLSAFASAVAADIHGWAGTAPFAMDATAKFLRAQTDPLSRIVVPSTPPDVLRALGTALADNVALWAGRYADMHSGQGWPNGVTPKDLTITPDGAVYYGNYNLAALNWTFSGSTLAWNAPTPAQVTAGAPPVAGTLTFLWYWPDDPAGNSYCGPACAGTLTGTARSGAPAKLMSPLCSLSGFTIQPATLGPGDTATATLTLAAAAPYPGAAVTIVCQSPFLLAPACVNVPAGQTVVTFTVGPWNLPIPATGTFTVTLQALVGTSQRSASIVVASAAYDDAVAEWETPSFTASLTPSSVVGGGSCKLEVSLSEAVQTGTRFSVVSSSSNAAKPTASSVEIPAGTTSASVDVTTVPVSVGQEVTFYVLNISDTTSNKLRTPVLAVGPMNTRDVRVASIYLNPRSVIGGDLVTATLVLNYPAPEELSLIRSSNTDVVAWPASMSIPAGESEVTVQLTTSAVSQKISTGVSAQNSASTAAAVTAYLTVGPFPTIETLTISPSPIHGETSAQAGATLSTAPARPVHLTVESSYPAVVQVDAPVRVEVVTPSQTAGWKLSVSPPSDEDGGRAVTLTLRTDGTNTPTDVTVVVWPEDITESALNYAGFAVGAAGFLLSAYTIISERSLKRENAQLKAAATAAENTITRLETELQQLEIAAQLLPDAVLRIQPPIPA